MPQCPKCGSEYDGGTHFCAEEVRPPRAYGGEERFLVSRAYDAGSLLGSYELKRLLGEGAIGRVYLAEHRELGRKVAIKTLRSEFAESPIVVKRFFGEARAVNQIAHENIVEITDFVRDGPNCFYIMELLHGETLASRFLRHGGYVPVNQLVRIARQIASALEAVHQVGIVHRDLKPENVFLTLRDGADDFVKVLDFGVAKLARDDEKAHKTVAGTLVGTPEYMSPEQAVGGTVDARADVYSLGAVLYEMATGWRVFPRASTIRDLIHAHLDTTVAPISQLHNLPQPIPPSFEALVMRCLAKDTAKRIQTMREVLVRLEEVAEETSDIVRVRVSRANRPKRIALAAVAAALLIPALVAIAAVSGDEEPVRIAAAADQVELRVDSTPPGATVRHVETSSVLGKTPLVTRLPRAQKPQHLSIKLDGFEDALHPVTLDQAHRTSIMLRPRSPRRSRRR